MTSDVIILCWDRPTAADVSAQKIASFLGASTSYLSLSAGEPFDKVYGNQQARSRCLVAHAETLARVAEGLSTDTKDVGTVLGELTDAAFIYGFESGIRHQSLLQRLSDGGLVGLQPLIHPRAAFHVTKNFREACGPFSGLSVDGASPTRDSWFAAGPRARPDDWVITCDAKPFLVRLRRGKTQVFLAACRELADLDDAGPSRGEELSWFSRFVPLMMFLRGALGDRVWHTPNSRACFIIDDPLLTKHYGFLDYARLSECMRRAKFSTSIAFIPWNYRRSTAEVASLWSSYGKVASLCVHGSDHTRAEFSTTDLSDLCGKATEALRRMRAHQSRFGVPFDNVMVFPQGLFSEEALEALETAGYLAAVNSDVRPSTGSDSVSLRDVLDVAVTRFKGVPLFGRRYPRQVAEFAFDLFMGKPALAVEHHEFFRRGYADLEAFVEQLNGLDQRLEWTNLGTICAGACLQRRAENGEVLVRSYANRFRLANDEATARDYVVLSRNPIPVSPAARIDGTDGVFRSEDGRLEVRVRLNPGQTVDVELTPDRREVACSVRKPPHALHNGSVWVRRHLSEFRDNRVATSRVARAVALRLPGFGRSPLRRGSPATVIPKALPQTGSRQNN
jgi:hypothetical protein